MRIDVQIDRLVLDGLDVPAGGEDVVRSTLEATLGAMLQENDAGLAARPSAAIESLRVPDIPPSGSATPAALGAGIARAIHGGLAE